MHGWSKVGSRWFLGAVALAACLGLAQADALAETKETKTEKQERQIRRTLAMADYLRRVEQNLEGAAKEYKKVLQLDKGQVRAGLALAEIAFAKKDLTGAEKTLVGMSKATPRELRVWTYLGEVHQAQARPDAALAAYQQALTVDPRDDLALSNAFQITLRQFREGKPGAKAALAAATDQYLAHGRQRMRREYQLAERTEAELSGGALGVTIFDARAAYDGAWSERRMGRINQLMGQARTGFETCLAEKPELEVCHYYLGLVLASVKASQHYDVARAKEELKKAPGLANAHVELARLARAEEDFKAAETSLREAIRLDPQHQQAQVELGIVLKLDGRGDDAVLALIAAHDADPSSSGGDRALTELAKIRPEHERVVAALRFGKTGSDVFSTEKFKGAKQLLEANFGGVQEDAPEKKVLEQVITRLVKGADVDPAAYRFEAKVLNAKIVNAFALPDGSVYATRGFFDLLTTTFPDRPIDADHEVIGHVFGHEIVHVIRHHTVRTQVYKEATAEAGGLLDLSVLVHVTRLHEIEADREGMVMAFLAGYHPRGGIEFMEAMGKLAEVPAHLDHPTFDERVHYLEEFWSNDVRYAWSSFSFGLQKLETAQGLEGSDLGKAKALYVEAIDDFKRFRNTLTATKEILNNLGLAYAKVGVLGLSPSESVLFAWQTPFSVEKSLALKFVSVAPTGAKRKTRGVATGEGAKKREPPSELQQAVRLFEEALVKDGSYARARVNLAIAHLAMDRLEDAERALSGLAAEASDAAAVNVQGLLAALQGKSADAEAHFKRAMGDAAAARQATYNLAYLYARVGRAPEAKALYQRYATSWPEDTWTPAAKQAADRL
jgi:predicted Zn-dependent protease